jgi:hypothetical protein
MIFDVFLVWVIWIGHLSANRSALSRSIFLRAPPVQAATGCSRATIAKRVKAAA